MDLNALTDSFGGYTFITYKEFSVRKHNSFDRELPVVIALNGEKPDFTKLNDVFGEGGYEEDGGFVVSLPQTVCKKKKYGFSDLIEIIWRLRDPDGCPWDKAQTLMSIRTNAVEESYELVEAVELNDDGKMREEFGDVLLQGLFNAVIAESEGRFTVNDVINELCVKLVTRHTHIFGDNKANNADEALKFWDAAKAKEKKQKSVKDKIDSVPTTFTALLKANKVQKIIKKTGFDFPTLDEAVKKIYEETEEFVTAEAADKEKEAGDMLFSVVNVLRMSNIDPEIALNGTTNRFIKRFEHVVEGAEKQGKKVEELSLDEMENLYQEAKKYEHNV